MAWLINVCSAKRDVYTPFDKQTLVWTGYYHSIAEEFSDWEAAHETEGVYQGWVYDKLESGEALSVTVDDGGVAVTEESPAIDYFKGESSEDIFGGEYICKYAFRTTSHSYGHSWFRASTALGDAGPGDDADDEDYKVIAHAPNLDQSKNTRQKDVPDFLSVNDFGTNWGTSAGMAVWNSNLDTLLCCRPK